MKSRLLKFNVACMLIVCFGLCIVGCKKENSPPPKTATVKLPVVTTDSVKQITQTAASCGGRVSGDSIGTITKRGICWSTQPLPSISDNKTQDGSDSGVFVSRIQCILPGTTYYVRAYATNSAGTAYGAVFKFTTNTEAKIFNGALSYGSIVDIDGNTYSTVQIGSQQWMAENLKVTRYRNGDNIEDGSDSLTWMNMPIGYRCVYGNNSANVPIYGRLYNFYAVEDVRNICPVGWHVPTDPEWKTLVDYNGGANAAGDKLLEIETAHWPCPNDKANNATGFTALGTGIRGASADYHNQNIEASWWTQTAVDTLPFASYYYEVINDLSKVNRLQNSKKIGLAVRCVKD